MKKKKASTELVAYTCPSCRTFNKPYFHNKKGNAFCLCSNCKAQYKTLTAVSASFRKFSSRQGRKPNKSPTYYSSSERAVKKYLERKGLIEGFDFFHNSRISAPNPNVKQSGRKNVYFWLDFIIPSKRLVIEVSPEIWHRLGDSVSKDFRKKSFVETLGWEMIELKSNDIAKLNRQKKPRKTTKRPEACKRIDEIFG